MAYSLTVRKLSEELKKYDPKAVVMIAISEEETLDAADILTYAYLTPEGELTTDDTLTDDDVVKDMKRAVVIWPSK